jgi:hypothetical protein
MNTAGKIIFWATRRKDSKAFFIVVKPVLVACASVVIGVRLLILRRSSSSPYWGLHFSHLDSKCFIICRRAASRTAIATAV